jgi:hypothetical protein
MWGESAILATKSLFGSLETRRSRSRPRRVMPYEPVAGQSFISFGLDNRIERLESESTLLFHNFRT